MNPRQSFSFSGTLKRARRALAGSVRAGFPVLCLLVWSACSSLPVRTLSPEYQTLFINFSRNSTFEYGAEERLTATLVDEFERDGRLKQVSRWQDADLILELDIKEFDLDAVTLDNDNRAAGRNLDITVNAGVRSPKTGAWVMPPQDFAGRGTFFLSNVPSGRREDDVYRRVAESIISRLLEGW